MSIEKRKCKRIAVKLEVYWERESGKQLMQITDLSLGGCFIRTLAQPEIGTKVNLELRLPSGQWLSLEGTVARCKPGAGFGVQFTPELIGHIMDLINPAQVKRLI